MEKNKPNPIAEVFSYAHDKKLIGLSVFLAVIAVLSGLLPYFAASYLVIGLINKTLTIDLVLLWGILAIGGYLLKTICLTFSSVCSHKMGYAVMAEIRTMLTQKLLRLSMGKATQRSDVLQSFGRNSILIYVLHFRMTGVLHFLISKVGSTSYDLYLSPFYWGIFGLEMLTLYIAAVLYERLRRFSR